VLDPHFVSWVKVLCLSVHLHFLSTPRDILEDEIHCSDQYDEQQRTRCERWSVLGPGSGPGFRRIRSRLQEDQVRASGGSGLGFRRIRSGLQEDQVQASGGSGPGFRRIRSRLQEDQVRASGGSGPGFRRIRSRLQEDQVQASGGSGPGFRRIRSQSDQVFVWKSNPEERKGNGLLNVQCLR